MENKVLSSKEDRELFIRNLVFALFSWSLLVFYQGYEVGIGDQVEFLPYALYLHDTSLFPFDLYTQSMEAMVVNERLFFAHLLSKFALHIEIATLIFHILFFIVMVLGMLRFAEKFIANRYLQYAVILFTLVITQKINTGSNEFYYTNFQGASIAKALAVWAFVFLLEKKYLKLSLFLITATLFQPLVGFHFFLLSVVAMIYQILFENGDKKQFFTGTTLYIFTAGLFIAGIKLSQDQEVFTKISNEEFIKIAYNFRLPHHFYPAYFSKKGLLLFPLLLVAGIYYFKKANKTLLVFLITLFTGIIIYLIGLSADSFLIISSWWFRSTIWIKFLGFVAVAGIINHKFSFRNKNVKWQTEILTTGMLTIILAAWFIFFPLSTPFKKNYHFADHSLNDPEIEICNSVKSLVTKDAVFIQPFGVTALKYYGQKSSFVEFKAVARRKDYLKIWYNRIREVYHIDYEMKEKGFKLVDEADKNFRLHNYQSLMKLKQKGVTHILTFKDHIIPELKIVGENSKYKVYEL